MGKYVITIGRQFGSMGRPIGKLVAENLEIGYYDRDIVEEVAKRMEMPLNVVSKEEEAAERKFGSFGKMLFPIGDGTSELQDTIFRVQECVIRDFMDKAPCILVGRCADYIARNAPHLFRIYIYAPVDQRIKNCIRYFNMTETDAKKMCSKVDKARIAYHKRYTGYEPTSLEHVDLMINSSVFGIEGTASVLRKIIQERFGV